MEGKQLWTTALGNLEVTLSRANFTTWLKSTRFLEMNDDILTIGVANIFTKEWLENKYHTKIMEACRQLHPNLKNVVYKVSLQTTQPKGEFVTTQIKTVNQDERVTFEKPSTRYTFESFVVGSNNRLAHAAAMAVANNPGGTYNPLFLYGGVGLGKTHLMQSIGNHIKKTSPEKKIMYCSSEKFTNELINAIQTKSTNEFKDRYRAIDLLLVDDIQFIAGKEQTQEEFFHTFNHLYEAGKQIVLTSDRPPRAIQTLEERLSSRFEWGMIADVQPPDLETRMAILQRKAGEASFPIDQDIIAEIATSIQHNIRELEGALTRLIAYCQIYNEPPTKQMVEDVLSSILNNPDRQTITHKKILSLVAKHYNISQSDIMGQKRNKEIVLPRQVSIYLMRKELGISYPKIGKILGGRDHTTIIHGFEKMEKVIKEDDELATDIHKLKENLYME